jgi:hypothetical protein
MTGQQWHGWAGRGAGSGAQAAADYKGRHGHGALQAEEQGQVAWPPLLVGRSASVGQELVAPDHNDRCLSDGHQAHEGTHGGIVPARPLSDTWPGGLAS